MRSRSTLLLISALCAWHSGPGELRADPPESDAANMDAEQPAANFVRKRSQDLSALLADDAKHSPRSSNEVVPPGPRPNWHTPAPAPSVGRDGVARFKRGAGLTWNGLGTWWDRQHNDRIARALPPPSSSEPQRFDPTRDLPLLTLLARFDLYELLIGKSDYEARERFLRSTERRRAWLALQDRLCGSSDARALQQYLQEVLAAQPFKAQKVQLFEVYDACSASVLGGAARSIILRHARDLFPRDSEHAYTATELAALNEARYGDVPFEPYAASEYQAELGTTPAGQ